MNLPRLILADDIEDQRAVPPSVLLVQAMKSRGMCLNIFMSSRKEEDLRLMELLSGDAVTCIDAYTAGNAKNLKALLQRRSTPDAIGLICVPLGKRIGDKLFQVYPEPLELAKVLNCGILPVLHASASAAVTTGRALSMLSSVSEMRKDVVQGLLFASIRNPREFQLLEQEYNRRSPILSLGYIPKSAERDMPTMPEMSPRSASMKLLQLKSAALQLGNAARQVEWQIIEAMARLNEAWTPVEGPEYSACRLDVAVINRDVALEGEESLEAFRALGCTVRPCNPEQDPFPESADVLYFPHAMTDVAAGRILSSPGFRQGLLESVRDNKPILAVGSSAVLFGQHYRTAVHSTLEGLGLFPFQAHHVPAETERGVRRIEIRGTKDTPFIRENEKLRGYEVGGFALANPGNPDQYCFAYRNMNSEAETGVSGWSQGCCFVTGLRPDLWSNLGVLYRWLSQRRR